MQNTDIHFLPFINGEIAILFDHSDVYLHRETLLKYTGVTMEGYLSPDKAFITREGFFQLFPRLSTLAGYHLTAQELLGWYKTVFVQRAAELFQDTIPSDNMVKIGTMSIRIMVKNEVVYYHYRDLRNYLGLGKDNTQPLSEIAILGPGSPRPAYYISAKNLKDTLQKMRKPENRSKLIDFLNRKSSIQLQLPDAAYAMVAMICDNHNSARQQICDSLCEMLKHYGSL